MPFEYFMKNANKRLAGHFKRVYYSDYIGNLIIKIIEFFFFMSEDSIKFYIINYRKFHSGGSMLHLFGLL